MGHHSGAPVYHTWILLLLFSFASCSMAQSTTYPLYTPYPATTTANFYLQYATGDFDGDGKPDVIGLGEPNGNINIPGGVTMFLTVFKASSQPNQYTPLTSIPLANCVTTGSLAYGGLLAADLNGDHKLDVALFCGSNVIVALGNGDGTFGTPTYTNVNAVNALVATDLNHDGSLELVASSSSRTGSTTNTSITVLTSQGSSAPAVYNATSTYVGPAGTTGNVIGTGDFNGDGKMDVLFYSADGQQFIVYPGNGDGTLQSGQVLAGGYAAVVADLNHDGVSDIAWADAITGAVRTYLGSPSGLAPGPTFTFPSTWLVNESSVAPIAAIALAGTRNAAKNVDLAVTIGPATTILLGDGAGGFALGGAYPFSFSTTQPTSGNTNLLLTGNTLLDVLGNGDGTFQFYPTTPFTSGAPVATADFNNDGLTDLLTIDGYGNLNALLSTGDGRFRTVVTSATNHATVMAGDFNNDGKSDAVGITPGHGIGHGSSSVVHSQLYFYAGNGDGTFAGSPTPIDVGVVQASSGVTADFNKDGKLDLLLPFVDTYSNTTGIVLLLGNGDGTFRAPVTVDSYSFDPATQSPRPSILVGDFNGDGKLGFAFNGVYYLGHGDATFTRPGQSSNSFANVVLLADLNGDGKPDIVRQDTQGQFKIYAGNGDGTFQSSPFYSGTLPQQGTAGEVAAGDVNGDGFPDIIWVSNAGGTDSRYVAVFLNNGLGSFTMEPSTYPLTTSMPLVIGRFNANAPSLPNDKYLDLALLGDAGATVLLNTHFAALSATSIQLTAAPVSTAPNQTINLTATLNGGPAGAQIVFTTGSATLGTVATNTAGVASLSTSFASPGVYPIIATYAGDATHAPANSAPVSVTATGSTSITATANPSTGSTNQPITYTATLTGAPAGSLITFANAIGTVGSGNTDSSGKVTYATTYTTAGVYTLRASFAGDTSHTASSTTVSVTIVGTTSIILSASPLGVGTNQQVAFAASVVGSSAGSTVTFTTGSTTLGTATTTSTGVAPFNASFSTPGTYPVIATFAGDAIHSASTSNTVTITVVAPDFSFSANPTSFTATRGQTAQTVLTVTPIGGYSSTVTFTCGSLPSEATCTFTPVSVTPSGGTSASSTLSIFTAASHSRRTTMANIGGVAGFGMLSLLLVPRRRRRIRRVAASLTLMLFLAVVGCGGGGSVPMDPGTPPGVQTIVVTATGAGASHSVSLQVTVQ